MDRDVIIIIIVGTLILMLLASFSISLFFAYQKRYYKYVQDMNAMKEKYEQELLKTQLEIKEQTMHNISQEIHDNIGQILSLVNLQLTAIELEGNEYATNKINKSMQLVSKAITDLRDLSKSLNAEHITKSGLKAAVQFDLDLIEKSGMYSTSFKVSGAERRLEDSREIIIFRIIQEALNNIIKHAKATQIITTFDYTEDKLLIQIIDNGTGFDNGLILSDSNTGAGLRNMINRAQIIKASMSINTTPTKGTTIQLSVSF